MDCYAFAIYQPFESPNMFPMDFLGISLGYYLYIANILTLLGSGGVVLSYILIPELRKHPTFPYLIHLSTTEFLANIFNFFQISLNDDNKWYATVMFELQFWLILASIIWTTFIAINFYRLVIHRDKLSDNNKLHWKYPLMAYGLPTLLLPLIAQGQFADNSEWVFVSQLPINYIPLWLCIGINTVLYLKAAIFLKRMMNGMSLKKAFLEFFWYPLILMLCWILNTLVYALVMIQFGKCGPGEEGIPLSIGLQILAFVGTFTARLQGFLNGFVYLRTRSVWKIIRQSFSKKSMDSTGTSLALDASTTSMY